MSTTITKLTDHKVLIFDVYGTLADWETGMYNALVPLLHRYPASTAWSRKDALTAFGSIEADLQAQFPEMLQSDLLSKANEVLESRLRALSNTNPAQGGATGSTLAGDPETTVEGSANASAGSSEGAGTSADGPGANAATSNSVASDSDAHRAFGSSIPNWPIFPDTCDALRRLSKHFKLVVLSNIDRESFKHTHQLLSEGPTLKTVNSDLGVYTYPDPNPNKYWHPQDTKGSKSPFTLILTAQDTGCYKPATGGFIAALDYISSQAGLFGNLNGEDEGVKGKVLSVAQSLVHDHEPASQLGVRSVWIDRQSAVTCNETPGGPGVKDKWTWRFETLGEMADAVEKEAD